MVGSVGIGDVFNLRGSAIAVLIQRKSRSWTLLNKQPFRRLYAFIFKSCRFLLDAGRQIAVL